MKVVSEGFAESIGKIGRTTLRDVSFRHSYSRALSEAQEWLELFRISGKSCDLHQVTLSLPSPPLPSPALTH